MSQEERGCIMKLGNTIRYGTVAAVLLFAMLFWTLEHLNAAIVAQNARIQTLEATVLALSSTLIQKLDYAPHNHSGNPAP
jgi:hypothetical protein